MSELLKKIRKGRERIIEVSGFRFTYRRPTAYEAAKAFHDNATSVEIAVAFVTGWEGVKECDIVDGATTDPAEFSRELWTEWCHDRRDFWIPIRDAVMEAYVKYSESMESEAKN